MIGVRPAKLREATVYSINEDVVLLDEHLAPQYPPQIIVYIENQRAIFSCGGV
jgi:hypothetical protein